MSPLTNEQPKGKVLKRIVLVLTGAAALPPLAIDMYLASLPEISRVFDVPVSISQLTLTLFLLMLGVGQLIAGPVTDAVGRKKPLVTGLAVFAAGGVLAALAPTMGFLIFARLLQGAGGSIAVVVAYSSIRDHASGSAATKLYAVLMSVVGIAPVIAPTVGGFIDELFGWRAIFWALAALGVLLVLGAVMLMPESLPPARREPLALGASFRSYRVLLGTRAFVVPAAALVTFFGLLFAYIGGSSYVYQGHYGLSAGEFGVVFGASGLAMLVGTVLVNRLSGHFASLAIALAGGLITVVGAVAAVIAVSASSAFAPLLIAVVVTLFGLGLTEPALMGESMSSLQRNAGQAAALLGGSQFLLGAVATILIAPVSEASPAMWALVLVGCAVVGTVLTYLARCAPRLRSA